MTQEVMLFDQYSRYRVCAELVSLNTKSPSSIVDIGCGADCLLAEFLKHDSIAFVDPLLECRMEQGVTTRENYPRLGTRALAEDFTQHAASGLAYSVVVAVDTYEHIKTDKRRQFLESLDTLAKDLIVIGFPSSDTTEAKDVDYAVDQMFITYFGHSYPWLAEHRDYGLPSHSEAESFFKERGWHTAVINQGNTAWLTKLLPVIVCLWEIPQLRPIAYDISKLFNEKLAAYDFLGKTGYRKFIIAKRTEQPQVPVQPKISSSQDQQLGNDVTQKILEVFLKPLLCEQAGSAENLTSAEHVNELLSQKDREIMRLNALVANDSKTITRMMQDVSIRDEEIFRLQKVVEQASDDIKNFMQQVTKLTK